MKSNGGGAIWCSDNESPLVKRGVGFLVFSRANGVSQNWYIRNCSDMEKLSDNLLGWAKRADVEKGKRKMIWRNLGLKTKRG